MACRPVARRDGVGPGNRLDDVAPAVWCFARLTGDDVPLGEQARRTALTCNAYPGTTPAAVVEALTARFDRARSQRAAARRSGGAAFEHLLRWMERPRRRPVGGGRPRGTRRGAGR